MSKDANEEQDRCPKCDGPMARRSSIDLREKDPHGKAWLCPACKVVLHTASEEDRAQYLADLASGRLRTTAEWHRLGML